MTPTERETARDALRRALAAAGGTAALAREIGIKSPAISQWAVCPPLRVIAVEAVTGVSRHDLRPDIHPRPPADRGTYIGLTRTAAADMNAPSDNSTRAQGEGLPGKVRNDEADRADGGGQGTTAQASAFVTVSGAAEAGRTAVDPAPAPDAIYPRVHLPAGWRLSADGDRLSPREV